MTQVTKFVFAILSVLAPTLASAQTVGDIFGNVLVNSGHGFAGASPGQLLSVGDKIMAKVGSSAILRFADGCDVNILPGAVFTVGGTSPCTLTGNAQNGADGTGSLAGTGSYAIAGGGVLVGMGALIAITNSKPTSP